MGVNASIVIECDNCATEDHDDLNMDESPEDFIDKAGWSITGNRGDRLLCGDCYEEEEGG